ncbi:MAG: UDP-2,3-diacylglucosamine diphosphatase LpxI [Planctomycetaceae bacterium]|nr:UDP-2,3-diacylglucosamine diphosphatase LpxI [Planctomycetaceae bacterium]
MSGTLPSRIGLIAGWGRYPIYLAEALKQRGAAVYCLGIVNHADPKLKTLCDDYCPLGLGKLQTAFRFFRQHGLTCGTMAGKINKKLLLEPMLLWRQLPDWYTLRTFAPMFITGKKNSTDDTLLGAVVNAFAKNGFRLLPGTDLIPDLLVKRQKLTRRGPTSAEWKDICFGWKLAKEMGRLDIGQSVCVSGQTALAVEAIEGTDECIRRAGSLCPGKGFTVVKVAKPQQDMRFDVPTFGLFTLQTMHESGARVLAVEANRTIFIDRQDVADFADQYNICIVSIHEDDSDRGKSPFAEFPD